MELLRWRKSFNGGELMIKFHFSMIRKISMFLVCSFTLSCSITKNTDTAYLSEKAKIVLAKGDGFIGKVPAGVLKNKVDEEIFQNSEHSFFRNQHGLMVYSEWNNAILCIVLAKNSSSRAGDIDLMNATPMFLFKGDNDIGSKINKSWIIKSWLLHDRVNGRPTIRPN